MCHALPCFGSSILKPISCYLLKKTMLERSEHRWVLYIWVLFFNMYNNVEFTQSCFPLSPPPIFLLHTWFQSVPSAPPVILSSLLLLPQTHWCYISSQTFKPTTLKQVNTKIRAASPASPGREPARPRGARGGCCRPLELPRCSRSRGFTLPSSWSLFFPLNLKVLFFARI